MNGSFPPCRLELPRGPGGPLDVQRFVLKGHLHGLGEISVTTRSDESCDLGFCLGQPATLVTDRGQGRERRFRGIVARVARKGPDEQGRYTCEWSIVPSMWLLTQVSTGHHFRDVSAALAACSVLDGLGITPVRALSSEHPKRPHHAQQAETDYELVLRLLDLDGVSFCFDEEDRLTLNDAPEKGPLKGRLPIRAQYVSDGDDHAASLVFDWRLTARRARAPGRGQAGEDAAEMGRFTRRTEVTFRTNASFVWPGAVVSFEGGPKEEEEPRYLVTFVEIAWSEDGEWTQVCRAVDTCAPFDPPAARLAVTPPKEGTSPTAEKLPEARLGGETSATFGDDYRRSVAGSEKQFVGYDRVTQVGESDALSVGMSYRLSVGAHDSPLGAATLTLLPGKIELTTRDASIELSNGEIRLRGVRVGG